MFRNVLLDKIRYKAQLAHHFARQGIGMDSQLATYNFYAIDDYFESIFAGIKQRQGKTIIPQVPR